MKKIIGGTILAMVFALLIGTTCVVCGWKTGLIIWAIAFVISLVLVFAIFLIEEGE